MFDLRYKIAADLISGRHLGKNVHQHVISDNERWCQIYIIVFIVEINTFTSFTYMFIAKIMSSLSGFLKKTCRHFENQDGGCQKSISGVALTLKNFVNYQSSHVQSFMLFIIKCTIFSHIRPTISYLFIHFLFLAFKDFDEQLVSYKMELFENHFTGDSDRIAC